MRLPMQMLQLHATRASPLLRGADSDGSNRCGAVRLRFDGGRPGADMRGRMLLLLLLLLLPLLLPPPLLLLLLSRADDRDDDRPAP